MVAATVGTIIYKVGDRVRLRKKPMAASHLKRGDVIQVQAIHPVDGSIKFWNSQSERWEFAYPDEIGRLVDCVTPAEVAVTESTSAPGNDSVSTDKAQIADTEYTVPPADNYDSVSTDNAQIADTEYTVPPADNYDSVSSRAISTYHPRGTARSGEYFRFSYRDGSRMRHIHIRGGNTDSPIAQAKVQEVRSLLAAGVPLAEIAVLLKA